MEIVGGGVNDQLRRIKFWNEGGATFVGNLGLGVENPSDKLAVNGLIQTSQGIKFPDQTVQNTAAFNIPESFPNQNALPQKQPFALIVTGNSPTITDTLEIVELKSGGTSREFGFIGNTVEPSVNVAQDFNFTINLENASQILMQRLTQSSPISKLTIYFPDLNSSNYQKAIEMRNVYLKSINFKSNFIGNNQYVNLLEMGVIYQQLELRSINASSCFCWNFTTQTPCTCD